MKTLTPLLRFHSSSSTSFQRQRIDHYSRTFTFGAIILLPSVLQISSIVQIFNAPRSLSPSCKLTNLVGTISLQVACIILLLWTNSGFGRFGLRSIITFFCLLVWLGSELWSITVLSSTESWLQDSTSIYNLTPSSIPPLTSTSHPICLPPFTILRSQNDKSTLPSTTARFIARLLPGATLLVSTSLALIAQIHSLRRKTSHDGRSYHSSLEEGGKKKLDGRIQDQESEERDHQSKDGFKMTTPQSSTSTPATRGERRRKRQEASDSTLTEVNSPNPNKSLKKLHLSSAGRSWLHQRSSSSASTGSSDDSSPSTVNHSSTSDSASILAFSLLSLLSCLIVAFATRRTSWRGSGSALIEIGFASLGWILRFVFERRCEEDRKQGRDSRELEDDGRKDDDGIENSHPNPFRSSSSSDPPQEQIHRLEEGDTTLVADLGKFSPPNRQRTVTSESIESNQENNHKGNRSGNEWGYCTISKAVPDSPRKRADVGSSLIRSSIPSSILAFDHNHATFDLPFAPQLQRTYSDSASVASTAQRLNSRLVAEDALTGGTFYRPTLPSPLPSYLLSTERVAKLNSGPVDTRNTSSFASSNAGDETLLRRLRAQETSNERMDQNGIFERTPRNPFTLQNSPFHHQEDSTSVDLGGGHNHHSTKDTESSFGNIENDLIRPELKVENVTRPALVRSPLSIEGEKVLVVNKSEGVQEKDTVWKDVSFSKIESDSSSLLQPTEMKDFTVDLVPIGLGDRRSSRVNQSFSPSPLSQVNRSSMLNHDRSSTSFLDLDSSPKRDAETTDSRPTSSYTDDGDASRSQSPIQSTKSNKSALSRFRKVLHSRTSDLISSSESSSREVVIPRIVSSSAKSHKSNPSIDSNRSLKSPKSSTFSFKAKNYFPKQALRQI